jgi:hypothetical protein
MAAVHCKAGKGRAGMMICCWLVHSKVCASATEAMEFYGQERTYDAEGVTIPSQRRYVGYYEDIVAYGLPEPPKITLKTITFQCSKYVHPEAAEPWCEVLVGGTEKVFESNPKRLKNEDFVVELKDGLQVQGDIKIMFYDKTVNKKGKEIAHVWFNTAFIDDNKMTVTKPEIDKLWQDRKHKKFRPEFEIVLEFEGSEVSTMSQLKKKAKKKKRSSKKSNSSEKKEKESTKKSEDKKETKSPKKTKKKSSKKDDDEKNDTDDKKHNGKDEQSDDSANETTNKSKKNKQQQEEEKQTTSNNGDAEKDTPKKTKKIKKKQQDNDKED